MRYNGPSLKRWVGGRVEQPKKPCRIGMGSAKLNGSSEGDVHAMNAANGRNRTHQICGIASEVVV